MSQDWFKEGLAAARRGDYAGAARLWTVLAGQGDARAQFNFGVLYSNDDGVPPDYVQALKWYRKAAELTPAQFAQCQVGQPLLP